MIDKNKKVYIIHGKENPYLKVDGSIDALGDCNDSYLLHSSVLLDFAKKNYKDAKIFEKLTYKHNPELISYFYTKYGDIIVLNTSRDEDVKSNRKISLILLMPNDVSGKQKSVLYDVLSNFDGYNVEIIYDLDIVDGLLDGKELALERGKSYIDLLDSYFNNSSILIDEGKKL